MNSWKARSHLSTNNNPKKKDKNSPKERSHLSNQKKKTSTCKRKRETSINRLFLSDGLINWLIAKINKY